MNQNTKMLTFLLAIEISQIQKPIDMNHHVPTIKYIQNEILTFDKLTDKIV